MATKYQQYESVLDSISKEIKTAEQKFRPIASPHEGYAIILEELDEYWDEVKLKYDKRTLIKMRRELIQVAAMCVRTIVDCLGEDAR